MRLPKKCKEEIKSYVDSKGFDIIGGKFSLFEDDKICRGYYIDSQKGIKRKFADRFGLDYEWVTLDKWFLEFIGHILRKYKINNIEFAHNDRYTSTEWKFNNIKKIIPE